MIIYILIVFSALCICILPGVIDDIKKDIRKRNTEKDKDEHKGMFI